MDGLPIIRPTLPALAEVMALVEASWASSTVTVGSVVQRFEAEVAERLGVRHVVAVSSCTAGLMLVPRALKLPPGGEVIVPSFTFAATAQALAWNGLVPVFCDCLPGTCTLDPSDVERNLSSQTVAICPVTIHGLPPDVEPLLELGKRAGIPMYFDSAQGLGATYQGRLLGGFGCCEVFSLSPTKVVTGIEGGLVTTDDESLAERIRSLRDYGKDRSTGEDMVDLGLSARPSELHAAVGLLSFRQMETLVRERLTRILRYRERLGKLPGCWIQSFPGDRTSSGNYFVLFLTEWARYSRDVVYERLKQAGIQTKRYFFPSVHEQTLFQQVPVRLSTRLMHTVKISREALALPLYSHMTEAEQERVCEEVEALLG